jgi:1,2-phenylacetyl-CoA epoxidase PaaB subunit
MWVIVKMVEHHTGVVLPVILVDSYSEIMSFDTEEEALKMKEIFEVNSDSGYKYLVKKH